MKALSLWQPHAQAIALGLKRWETRDWPTKYRGPLAIHAAQRPWNDVGEWHREARRRIDRHIAQHGPITWAFGAVVCVVDVVDCTRTSELRRWLDPLASFWGDFSDGENCNGRWGFTLDNVRVLPQPVAWRGQQGFFEVELEGAAVARDTATLPLFPEGE
jgi:activating signal cointegrator 1